MSAEPTNPEAAPEGYQILNPAVGERLEGCWFAVKGKSKWLRFPDQKLGRHDHRIFQFARPSAPPAVDAAREHRCPSCDEPVADPGKCATCQYHGAASEQPKLQRLPINLKLPLTRYTYDYAEFENPEGEYTKATDAARLEQAYEEARKLIGEMAEAIKKDRFWASPTCGCNQCLEIQKLLARAEKVLTNRSDAVKKGE